MTAIDITMRHGNLPGDLEEFVGDKIGRMEKYLKDSSRVEVVLDRENDHFKCELILHSARRGGSLVVVKDAAPEIRSAIDLALEKLSRQLAKNKERRKDHHRGTRIRDELAPADGGEEGGDEPSYEDIVNREIKGD